MSTGQIYGDTQTRTVTMDSNLTDKEGYAVNLDATDDNNVNLASDATKVPFVLLDGGDGSSADYNGSIAVGGRTKVKLGGTVAPGDRLTSDGNGKWVTTTTDHNVFGAIAMQIGVANDVIEVLVAIGTVSA